MFLYLEKVKLQKRTKNYGEKSLLETQNMEKMYSENKKYFEH